jgi:glutathione S-transferase
VQVKLALYHKGLAFTKLLAKPCGGGGGLDPEFLARAPLGKIPALVVRTAEAAAATAAADIAAAAADGQPEGSEGSAASVEEVSWSHPM